jgi:DNA-nicking Smr family endonuclease
VSRKRRKNSRIPNLDNQRGTPNDAQKTNQEEFAELLASANFTPDRYKDLTAGEEFPDRDKKKTSRSQLSGFSEEITIDLHGLTATAATNRVDTIISHHDRGPRSSETAFKIITGKGRRSGPTGGVLSSVIHEHIRTHYAGRIKYLQSSPAEVTIEGKPIRGYFTVILGR